MDRSQEVVAALLAMGEGEVARVVAAAAARRPGLEALHAAALRAAGSLPRDPVDPSLPGPAVPGSGHPDVLDGELVADPAPAFPDPPAGGGPVADRVAAAGGAAELDAASAAGRADAVGFDARQRAGRDRLARLREELRGEGPG